MEKTIAVNRKAKRDYEVIRTLEVGIALSGPEAKSIRQGRANLKDSFAKIENGEVTLYHLHISLYKYSRNEKYNPERPRKLLLHKLQIIRLIGEIQRKGIALIPLRIYIKGKWIKLELALAKGRKLYDKRESLKKKEEEKAIRRALGRRR
jgi:SsrA-binding protein